MAGRVWNASVKLNLPGVRPVADDACRPLLALCGAACGGTSGPMDIDRHACMRHVGSDGIGKSAGLWSHAPDGHRISDACPVIRTSGAAYRACFRAVFPRRHHTDSPNLTALCSSAVGAGRLGLSQTFGNLSGHLSDGTGLRVIHNPDTIVDEFVGQRDDDAILRQCNLALDDGQIVGSDAYARRSGHVVVQA